MTTYNGWILNTSPSGWDPWSGDFWHSIQHTDSTGGLSSWSVRKNSSEEAGYGNLVNTPFFGVGLHTSSFYIDVQTGFSALNVKVRLHRCSNVTQAIIESGAYTSEQSFTAGVKTYTPSITTTGWNNGDYLALELYGTDTDTKNNADVTIGAGSAYTNECWIKFPTAATAQITVDALANIPTPQPAQASPALLRTVVEGNVNGNPTLYNGALYSIVSDQAGQRYRVKVCYDPDDPSEWWLLPAAKSWGTNNYPNSSAQQSFATARAGNLLYVGHITDVDTQLWVSAFNLATGAWLGTGEASTAPITGTMETYPRAAPSTDGKCYFYIRAVSSSVDTVSLWQADGISLSNQFYNATNMDGHPPTHAIATASYISFFSYASGVYYYYYNNFSTTWASTSITVDASGDAVTLQYARPIFDGSTYIYWPVVCRVGSSSAKYRVLRFTYASTATPTEELTYDGSAAEQRFSLAGGYNSTESLHWMMAGEYLIWEGDSSLTTMGNPYSCRFATTALSTYEWLGLPWTTTEPAQVLDSQVVSGAISGSVQATVDATGAMQAKGALTTGGLSATVSVTGSLTSKGPIAATPEITISVEGLLDAHALASAAPEITVSASGTMQAKGALAATPAITVSSTTSTLTGSGQLWVGPGTCVVAIHIDPTDIVGRGALAPDTLLISVLFAVADLTAAAGIFANVSVTVSVTGEMQATGALAATPSATVSVTGALTGTLSLEQEGPAHFVVFATGEMIAKGLIAATPSITVSATGTMQAKGALAATPSITVSSTTSTLTGSGALAATPAATVSVEGDLTEKALDQIAAAIEFTVSVTGTMAATGSLAATPSITVSSTTSTLTGSGALAATPTVTVSTTGAMVAKGLIAATPTVTVSVTGTPSATGALAATPSITISVTGTMQAKGSLAAAPEITVSTTGVMLAPGGMAAAPSITVSATGTMEATGSLSATPSITVSATGAMQAKGSLAAAPEVTVSVTGLMLAPGGVAGSLDFTVSVTGAMQATGALAGSLEGTISLTGTGSGGGILASAVSFSVTATGTGSGSGALAATPQATVSVAGALTEVVSSDLAANVAVTVSATGAMQGTGALAATPSITVSASASLILYSPIAGTALLEVSSSPALTATGLLDGDMSLAVTGSATGSARGALASSVLLEAALDADLMGIAVLEAAALIEVNVQGGFVVAPSFILEGDVYAEASAGTDVYQEHGDTVGDVYESDGTPDRYFLPSEGVPR